MSWVDPQGQTLVGFSLPDICLWRSSFGAHGIQRHDAPGQFQNPERSDRRDFVALVGQPSTGPAPVRCPRPQAAETMCNGRSWCVAQRPAQRLEVPPKPTISEATAWRKVLRPLQERFQNSTGVQRGKNTRLKVLSCEGDDAVAQGERRF